MHTHTHDRCRSVKHTQPLLPPLPPPLPFCNGGYRRKNPRHRQPPPTTWTISCRCCSRRRDRSSRTATPVSCTAAQTSGACPHARRRLLKNCSTSQSQSWRGGPGCVGSTVPLFRAVACCCRSLCCCYHLKTRNAPTHATFTHLHMPVLLCALLLLLLLLSAGADCLRSLQKAAVFAGQ